MALQIAIVLVAIVVVIGAVRLFARWQRPSHPPVDAAGLGEEPGVVIFTSTDCANCEKARRVIGSLDVPIREVTWELEPSVFEDRGVEAVPLTAVVDASGRVEYLTAGVPRKRSVVRAAERAGLAVR